jgi:predicted RNA-binding protein with PUA-like domain
MVQKPKITFQRPPDGEPAYWLMKSEPEKYSWQDLQRDGRTRWDGIRNHQAAIYLRSMKVGDLGLFYHSNTGLEVVGVLEIVTEAYPDPTDPAGRFVAVDVAPKTSLNQPVTLAQMKAHPALREMAMFRQFRLSLAPLTASQWATIMAMAN